MFGYREDYREWDRKVENNADKYLTKVYHDVYDFKKYI